MEIILFNQHFVLLPERAIYWKEQNACILSDLHIGKGMHFRKEGIPIPMAVFDSDLEKLNGLVHKYQARQLIVVGDMFHAQVNNEVHLFDIWRAQYPELQIHLVKGNHDIFSAHKYKEIGIEAHSSLEIGEIAFSHHPCKKKNSFCFCGHIHPGVRLNGKARQTILLPCFYFEAHTCILPAFTKFSGLALVEQAAGSKIYGVLEKEGMVVEVKGCEN